MTSRLPVICLLTVSLWPASAQAFQRAIDLEEAMRSLYAYSEEPGSLGAPLEGELPPNRMVIRVDPRIDRAVFCLTTDEGALDPRPLGSESVIECSYGGLPADAGPLCLLKKGQLVPLKPRDPRAKRRRVRQLTETFRPGWRDSDPIEWLEWVETTELDFIPRPPESVVRLPAPGKENGDTVAYRPGQNHKRFFRTPDSYWQNLYGKNVPVPKGKWMQLFKDGNYYQVEKGFHLEEWPAESGIAIRVDDRESWMKVGRGDDSYVLVEEVDPKATNWAKYFARVGYQPSNPKVDAIGACTPCPKKPRVK